jgi:MYND finger
MKAGCKAIGTHYCGGCENVFYCGREHQKEDWLKFHCQECKSSDKGEGGEGESGGEVPKPKPVPVAGSSFDPFTEVHPTSVGPDGVIPDDIWDPDHTSIYLDLKQVRTFCLMTVTSHSSET